MGFMYQLMMLITGAKLVDIAYSLAYSSKQYVLYVWYFSLQFMRLIHQLLTGGPTLYLFILDCKQWNNARHLQGLSSVFIMIIHCYLLVINWLIYDNWLVVSTPLKRIVNWDDYSPIYEKKIQTTNQIMYGSKTVSLRFLWTPILPIN